jgi:hypothetical protein
MPLSECHIIKIGDLKVGRKAGSAIEGTIRANTITKKEWNLTVGLGAVLFTKLSGMPQKLGDAAFRIFQGFKTGADSVFILDMVGKNLFLSNCLNREIFLENNLLRPLFKSGQCKRYNLNPTKKVIIFPYRNGELVPWADIEKYSPKTSRYLSECRQTLEKREGGKWAGESWYCFNGKLICQQ